MITNKEYIHSLITEALKKKKEEPKEGTGTGGGYGYSSPAFSMFAKDDVARSEYKRPKVKEVREDEEYCDSCDSVKSKCVCPKKVEATEATDSSSVGAYDFNSFQNVNMKGNTSTGNGSSWKKAQIPGGSFVDIDSKCKTFPYCNQGNTGAVRYKKTPPKNTKTKNTSKLSPMNEAILNVSLKTGLSVYKIKNIILSKIDGNL